MDISKLRSVCLVGKYRNYAEAAYHLCVSPSVLSKHISYVENELGVALFERANKSTPIKLTPVGEKILPCLNEMLDTYYKAVGIAKDYPESSENLLTVCTCPYIGDFHEPEMLSAFIREHPNTTIVRRVSSVRSIVEQICSGLADAAFLPVLNYIGSDDEYMPLANANISVDELFTIKSLKIGVGKSHPLAECTKITDTEFDLLHNDTFLFSLDQTDTRWPSKREHFKHLLHFKSPIQIRYVDLKDPSLVLHLVESGFGVIPQACCVPEWVGDVHFIPVEKHGMEITLYLVVKKSNKSNSLRLLRSKILEMSAQYR